MIGGFQKEVFVRGEISIIGVVRALLATGARTTPMIEIYPPHKKTPWGG